MFGLLDVRMICFSDIQIIGNSDFQMVRYMDSYHIYITLVRRSRGGQH